MKTRACLCYKPNAMIPRWEPDARNRASYGGFVAMVGGPEQRCLPEHEHPELQVSVHFGKSPSLELTASSEPHAGAWDQGERVAVMLLSPTLLAEVADDVVHGGSYAIRSGSHTRDGLIHELGRAVSRELSGPGIHPNRRLYFESLGYTLAGHVIRTYAEARARPASADTLSSAQLDRLSEFVDSALDLTIGVGDMASLLGVTPRFFADAFKRTTGQTPYQYVLHRRIDHAKRLLRGGRLPIAEVALRLGFANQSHFTAVFARVTGATPGRWRTRP